MSDSVTVLQSFASGFSYLIIELLKEQFVRGCKNGE